MKNPFTTLYNCLLALCVLLSFASNNYGQGSSAAISIKEPEMAGSPLRIVSYQVTPGANILKTITIEVKNISAKPVYFFRYAMMLRLPVPVQAVPCYQFIYNKDLQKAAEGDRSDLTKSNVSPLLPGQTVQLSLPDNIHVGLTKILADKYSLSETDIKGIDFVLQNVYFGDGTGWFAGANYPNPQQTTVKDNKENTAFHKVSLASPFVPTISLAGKPYFVAGCSTCAGACGSYSLDYYCSHYNAFCQDYVTDYQYSRHGNGSVRPTPTEEPCGTGITYYICLIDTCQQQ